MRSENGTKGNSKTVALDLNDFDNIASNNNSNNQLYEYNPSDEVVYGGASQAFNNSEFSEFDVPQPDLKFPTVKQSVTTSNLASSRTDSRNLVSNAQDAIEAKGDNKLSSFRLQFGKRAKKEKTPVKTDSRWRLLSGLLVFTVGLAGAIFLLQTNVQGAEVLVATHDIQAGQVVTSDDLSTAQLSAAPDYISSLILGKNLAALTDQGSQPHVATRLIRANQPIAKGDLVLPSALNNKNGVPDGWVALAIETTAANAPARINPGDHIALIYTPPANNNTGATQNANSAAPNSKLIIDDVRVLDVVRSSSSGSSNSLGLSDSTSSGSNSVAGGGTNTRVTTGAISNITLLVTLSQAETIEAAKNSGTITFVLLPTVATVPQTTSTIDSSSIITTPTSITNSNTATTTKSANNLPAVGITNSVTWSVLPSIKPAAAQSATAVESSVTTTDEITVTPKP